MIIMCLYIYTFSVERWLSGNADIHVLLSFTSSNTVNYSLAILIGATGGRISTVATQHADDTNRVLCGVTMTSPTTNTKSTMKTRPCLVCRWTVTMKDNYTCWMFFVIHVYIYTFTSTMLTNEWSTWRVHHYIFTVTFLLYCRKQRLTTMLAQAMESLS